MSAKYNITLCYHGIARTSYEQHTFRIDLEAFQHHIRYLQGQGYTFVKPSQFVNWHLATYNPSGPIACVIFDDGLATSVQAIQWMIGNHLPCGFAIIARRQRKMTPEADFASWQTIRSLIDSGYCEIVNHTYNLHHVAISGEDADHLESSPVLERPWWTDNGIFPYMEPGETRRWWDYSFVDTWAWRLPLFGSEPANKFTSTITTTLKIKADKDLTASLIRVWAAIHSFPVTEALYRSGMLRTESRYLGYDCHIKISINGTQVCDTTISPLDYDTRWQWPEREWFTIEFDQPYSFSSGNTYEIKFETLNTGDGLFCIYAIPTIGQDHAVNTNCTSLVYGQSGGDARNIVPGFDNYVLPCVIVGDGTGSFASDSDLQQVLSQDIEAHHSAVQNFCGATWTKHDTGYTEKEDPWLEQVAIAGTYPDGSLVDTKIKFVPDSSFTAHVMRIRNWNIYGDNYPLVVDVSISTSLEGPWTLVSRYCPNWWPWHWQEWELDTPFAFNAGQTYWIRFETRTRHPDPNASSVITMLYDMPPLLTLRSIKGCWTPMTYDYSLGRYVEGGCAGKDIDTGDRTCTWQVPQYEYTFYTNSFYFGTDTWPVAIEDDDCGYLGGEDCWAGGDWYYVYPAEARGVGRAFLELYDYSVPGEPASLPTTLAWPFGAYENWGNPVWNSPEDVHPGLRQALQNNNYIGAFTVYPSRPQRAGELVEPDRRHTEYTIPRLMVYGDTGQEQAMNNIMAYAGMLFPPVLHRGVKWQTSVEPDPHGNAEVRHNYGKLAYVCFDAWFWRKNGVIEPGDINDGGTYLGISSRTGEFQKGETVKEADTGATAEVVWATNNSYNDILKLTNLAGSWAGGKQITGQTSGATATEDPEGPVTYADDKTFLQGRGIQCLLIINNYNPEIDDIDPDIFEYVVTHPDEYIDQVVDICLDNGWDGIMATLEQQDSHVKDDATNFYKQLSRALHSHRKLVAAALPAITGTDYDAGWWLGWCDLGALARYLDIAKIMSYTESGDWSVPRAHAPQWFWDEVYAYTRRVVHRRFHRRIYVGCNNSCDVWYNIGQTGSEYCEYGRALALGMLLGGTVKVRESEGWWQAGHREAWMGIPNTLIRAVDQAVADGYGGIGIWKADDGDIIESYPEYVQIGRWTDMSFTEVRFPDDIAAGSVGGPQYKTDVVRMKSGFEQRATRWGEGLSRYDVSYGIRTKEDYQKVIEFFRARKGRAIGFRFKDWSDYKGTNEYIGTGDGSQTNFQLVKNYISGDDTETRPIKKPVQGTVRIFLDGVEQTSGWSCDYTTGMITFDTPPAQGVVVRATFEFDVPVRFDTDELMVTLKLENIGAIPSIPLVEIRL